MDIIWKDIPTLEDSHEICNFGIVRTKDTKLELKLRTIYSLWDRKLKKHVGFSTNSLLNILFDTNCIQLETEKVESKRDFFDGKIEDEDWKPITGYEEKYWISNYGRVFSFKSDRMLKPTINLYQYYYQLASKTNISVRKILLSHFKPSEIKYDIGIPPRQSLIDKIKSGKFGVSSYNTGVNKFRFVIQKDKKHYVGYFKTEAEARQGWIDKYCELHNINQREL